MQTLDAWSPPLSPREQEVLALLARGHTYASIAVALEISFRTVQGHVKGIYRKLDVASKAEAAVLAARAGLVS
ncbi:MAG TPA: helix-turn-helix transcriptional regulator [Myxococcaceae bacterium]|nr:helix-turn-helix transcriptional regulator [Myxococcaceae bacterium]